MNTSAKRLAHMVKVISDKKITPLEALGFVVVAARYEYVTLKLQDLHRKQKKLAIELNNREDIFNFRKEMDKVL